MSATPPPLRSIVVTTALALTAMGVVTYVSSCSSPQRPDERPPVLNKFGDSLKVPHLPPSPAHRATKWQGKTVADVLNRGCSTNVVRRLSEQIIAEGNCMQPGSYEQVETLSNVKLGSAVFPYMRKNAARALRRAVTSNKKQALTIHSMLRTVAQQYLLYNWYKRGRCNIKLAAVPGDSNHQGGLAIDVAQPKAWRKKLKRHGFRWLGKKDRWHFDYIEKSNGKRGSRGDGTGNTDIEAFQHLWNRNRPDEAISTDGKWGGSTEDALRRAPVAGFAIGPRCQG